ncbi:protein CURVATURE THYLAKOID 1D, chloroplastic-like [Impatiens glandulifera]|uniref:protein CURVATURE THYLAKOID 1D, chloroplastic-like n=1 Tax=Impatiens glandulifera TaxID=253017 RepID=UPI001FB19A1E|nr:protein CURVATURE THYLAKOID 1D, chloroplastic-like [Impatiens glandulifera]
MEICYSKTISCLISRHRISSSSSSFNLNRALLPFRHSSIPLRINPGCLNYSRSSLEISTDSFEQGQQPLQTKSYSDKEEIVTLTEAEAEAFPFMMDKLAAIKWDFDKYSLLLLGFGALVALWLATAVVAAVNTIPLVPKFLEMVGLSYTLWFSTRFLIFKENRIELVGKIEEVKRRVIGSTDD